jgi:hypothetical protein
MEQIYLKGIIMYPYDLPPENDTKNNIVKREKAKKLT